MTLFALRPTASLAWSMLKPIMIPNPTTSPGFLTMPHSLPPDERMMPLPLVIRMRSRARERVLRRAWEVWEVEADREGSKGE